MAATKAAAKDGSQDISSASSPSSPANDNHPYRMFSWYYWIPVTVALAALVTYFTIHGGDMKKVMIEPTVVMDERFGFTPETVRKTLTALGPAGRKLYTQGNRVDFLLMPIVLREFLLNTFPPASTLSDAIREVAANTYAVGDIVENVFVMMLLKGYPTVWEPFAWGCSVFNVLKWLGFFAAVLSILYELVVYLRGGSKVKTQ
jgi:hypothetical protein